MAINFSTEDIERFYINMHDSVDLINGVLAGTEMLEQSQEERENAITRNVGHLEYMLGHEFWTGQDMTAVEAAIEAGKA
tara:strand:+ start:206 stop:442 length:237 start_codon:yes stop_codon:yes gene_type:complete